MHSFPDIKVQATSSFPDLKVKVVDSFADSCGEWKIDRGQALRETGGKMLAPVRAVSQAFMTDDQAAAQLRATMAGSNGKPGADYQQVLDLAKSLGTDMPGSTADYIAMMNQLQRQGVSSQDVLGGVAQQAANLGAVLNMPAKEAGEFAAQLQQATRASAGDMAALADTVQRTSHLGLDPTGMVKGLDAIGKALPQLGQQGARSGQMFAPLLLMLNDASISGEAAGKAVGNLVKNSMDPAKLGQVNKMLAGQGVSLDFKDASGQFGGTEQMMAQLQKLQSLGSDKLRAAALDKLAGGDAQTRKALEALLQQGPGGYQQIDHHVEQQGHAQQAGDQDRGLVQQPALDAQALVQPGAEAALGRQQGLAQIDPQMETAQGLCALR